MFKKTHIASAVAMAAAGVFVLAPMSSSAAQIALDPGVAATVFSTNSNDGYSNGRSIWFQADVGTTIYGAGFFNGFGAGDSFTVTLWSADPTGSNLRISNLGSFVIDPSVGEGYRDGFFPTPVVLTAGGYYSLEVTTAQSFDSNFFYDWNGPAVDVGDVTILDGSQDGSIGNTVAPVLRLDTSAADTLAFNAKGIGHILYVPYFSTQEGNVTAINIVNTDTVNGKVLKVRFRGASNSDDVYDFQVFLSPGDVWTAGISQGADGRSQLATADKSCTLPANVNGAFITSRLPAAGGVAETREGYVEILTMADITPKDTDLFEATKHVKGVPPCTASVLTALTHENASDYMAEPTTGLMANWTIINVSRVVAYSGDAVAIEARDGTGVPIAGNLVYWDQRPTALSQAEAEAHTADPLLRGAVPVIAGARYDLPDLSTPYLPGNSCPFCQARALSDAIAVQELAGEYYSEPTVGAQTDWVISFPTRRYFAAVRYAGSGAPAIVRNAASDGNIYFTADNTELGSAANGGKPYQICAKLGVNAVAFYDREETPTVVDDIVISPGTPTALSICGEVTVVGVNAGSAANSATFGSLARANVANGFKEGWGSLSVPSENGLPMLARQFTRVNNTQTNVYYGLSYPARIVMPGMPEPFNPAP